MTYSKTKPVLAIAGVLLLAGGAFAQAGDRTGSNVSAAAKSGAVPARAVAIEHAHMAADLAAYGRERRNPTALLLAAQVQGEINAATQARPKTSEGTAAPGAAKNSRPELTPAALYADARRFAGADRAMLAQIDRAAGRQTKGRVGGPSQHVDRVLPGSTDVYNVSFRGGESARVAAIGDGDTDLDLRVYDEGGNLVCSDLDSTDRTICGWTPRWTGNFQVKVQNLGRVYNQYTLLTN